jgi:methyl-accepting chemotaxis protein
MEPTRVTPYPDAKRIASKLFMMGQAGMFLHLPAALYVITLVIKVPADKLLVAFAPLALTIPLFGTILPIHALKSSTEKALAFYADDAPGARLARILKLPRVIEIKTVLIYSGGTLIPMSWAALSSGLPYSVAPWATACVTMIGLLVNVWTRIFTERLLMPIALEEFLKYPNVSFANEKGVLWPKQVSNLPYSFALFIVITLFTMGTSVIRVSGSKFDELIPKLDPQSAQLVLEAFGSLKSALLLPLAGLGLFMLVSAALCARLIARHQYNGFHAIQDSIEGFVSGNPKQPEWVTTDELGDLSRVTAQAFNKMREFSLSIKNSASRLGTSAETLDQSNTVQNEVISRQAAALQEAQVTAQEIRQTSLMAAQKAEGVLQQTNTMEQIGREGESAIARSISSLEEIRETVTNMAARIKTLDERARQIENITRTVKDLADQSNMLALNAAIEAVRSGEHGKGFGVVAREIRSLADQSIKATGRVQQILQDISSAIRSTVAMTEQGVARVGTSVEEVRAFGDSMRKLSSLMQDSTSAVRQISASVSQQNQGISQIFQAINDLNTVMNETMVRLNKTNSVTLEVRGVATHVSDLIAKHGWEKATWQTAIEGQKTTP